MSTDDTRREALSRPITFLQLAKEHGFAVLRFSTEKDSERYWRRLRAVNYGAGREFSCVVERDGLTVTARSGEGLPDAELILGDA